MTGALIVGLAGGAVLLIVLLAVAFGSARPKPPPPVATVPDSPPPADRRPEPGPPVKSREELRQEEARRNLGEVQELEKGGRIAANEIRRRYMEFAREYADTPEGRKIGEWLKATESKPEPPKVAQVPKPPAPEPKPPEPEPVPKPPEPPKPVPPEPKPLEPAVIKPPPPPVPKHPAVPEAAKVGEAEAAYRKAFKPEQAKTPQEKAKLARVLLDAAASSGAKDAELYVLLREARDLSVQGMDVKTAIEAVNARAGAFDVDGMGEKVDLFAKTTVKVANAAVWSGAALDVAEEASEGDDYEAAVKLAARAEALARAANDRGLQETAKERGKELADLKRVADGLKGHFKALETKPDDPAANAAVGKFVSLVKGDWKRGLPMLAKGSEPAIKNLAEQELVNPTDPAAQAALGEAWASQAEKETPTYKPRARERAAEWLGRAIAGLTGIAKVSAEKKLASLGPVIGTKAQMTLDLGGGVRMEMVYIKPGTFTMGGTESPTEGWQADERPEHKVTITKGFYLGKYEVTQAQWEAVMGSNPSKWKGPDLPVEQVSWEDCPGFLKKLNEKAKNSLKGRMASLPTEAQWEYACRAGTKTRWSFGDNDGALGEYAWHDKNSGQQTHAVGQKKPNAWGLYDMHGNVWEWCQDWNGPYARDAVDPTGPASGERRCLRGGSWSLESKHCRVAFRASNPAAYRNSDNGFRVALP